MDKKPLTQEQFEAMKMQIPMLVIVVMRLPVVVVLHIRRCAWDVLKILVTSYCAPSIRPTTK